MFTTPGIRSRRVLSDNVTNAVAPIWECDEPSKIREVCKRSCVRRHERIEGYRIIYFRTLKILGCCCNVPRLLENILLIKYGWDCSLSKLKRLRRAWPHCIPNLKLDLSEF